MSHYSTRINITVKNPEVWKKLHAIDMGQYGFSCTAAELFTGNSKSFIIEGGWSATNDELEELVDAIVNAAAKECVVIADTSDLNSDEPPYCVYHLGENTHGDYYEGAASNAWEAYYLKVLGTLNKNDIAAFWLEIDPGMDEIYPDGKCEDSISDNVLFSISLIIAWKSLSNTFFAAPSVSTDVFSSAAIPSFTTKSPNGLPLIQTKVLTTISQETISEKLSAFITSSNHRRATLIGCSFGMMANWYVRPVSALVM